MKKLFLSLFILSMMACSKGPSIDDQTYPWQIKTTPAGNTQVFGIELSKTPLGRAADILKQRYELGLFEDKQGKLTLEAYFHEVTRGGLSGKLIVLLKAGQTQLQQFKANSLKGKPQESGVMKYRLTRNGQKLAQQLLVSSLSYIPYVNLEEETIVQRFGPADDIIQSKDGLTHYIYMKKGLDLIYSEEDKEILQYVSPVNMKALIKPLKDQ